MYRKQTIVGVAGVTIRGSVTMVLLAAAVIVMEVTVAVTTAAAAVSIAVAVNAFVAAAAMRSVTVEEVASVGTDCLY